jgi:hypothetical protein
MAEECVHVVVVAGGELRLLFHTPSPFS